MLLSVWTETRCQPRGVRPQPWGGASGDQGTRGSVPSCQSGGALASEPAPVAPRIPSSSFVAFFLTTEDQTSACTTGSCFGRSRNSRTMSSAAALEKQLPQHEFPLFRGRASAGNCGPRRGTELFSGAEFNFPPQGRTPSRTSPAAPRTRRGR